MFTDISIFVHCKFLLPREYWQMQFNQDISRPRDLYNNVPSNSWKSFYFVYNMQTFHVCPHIDESNMLWSRTVYRKFLHKHFFYSILYLQFWTTSKKKTMYLLKLL